MKRVFGAIKLTLTSKKHLAIVMLSSLIIISLAVFIPVFTIPGNSLSFQLSLLTWDSLALTILFSLLFGLSIAMHIYASSLNKKVAIGKKAGTSFVGFIATLFSAKLCPVCLITLFSILGIGGSIPLFLFSHRTTILITSLILLLASISLASRSIFVCKQCVR
ncbi:hypothetical protein HYV79_00300 [Candidatus Woesearchaeota archaeon]|nr:hypothetical protein [Candidatus Woesearchaeota archaeon]